MEEMGWVSGMDIENMYFQYDYRNDVLFVGIQCPGICGDADGNGDPDAVDDENFSDSENPDFGEGKEFSLFLWPSPDPEWQPTSSITDFFPTVMIGVGIHQNLSQFAASAFPEWDTCTFETSKDDPGNTCLQRKSEYLFSTSSDPWDIAVNLTELVSFFLLLIYLCIGI
jgi:hypothetical protein